MCPGSSVVNVTLREGWELVIRLQMIYVYVWMYVCVCVYECVLRSVGEDMRSSGVCWKV